MGIASGPLEAAIQTVLFVPVFQPCTQPPCRRTDGEDCHNQENETCLVEHTPAAAYLLSKLWGSGSNGPLTYVRVPLMADSTPDNATDNILVRKLGVSVPLGGGEKAALVALLSPSRTVPAGEDLLLEGQRPEAVFLVEDGWAIRYKLLPDGRRQVLNFVLPGDIVGLRENLFHVTPHSVGPLTDLVVSGIDPAGLIELFRDFPKLAIAVAWSAAREGAMMEEQVVRIGRRSAYESMAHLFLELLKRLQMVGQASAKAFELPVTQEVLADTLGLSVVHVNRTLRRFRKEGLLELEEGRIRLLDLEALARIADFESRYLNQQRLPQTKREQLLRIR